MVREAINGQVREVTEGCLTGFDHNGRYQGMAAGINPGGKGKVAHGQQADSETGEE